MKLSEIFCLVNLRCLSFSSGRPKIVLGFNAIDLIASHRKLPQTTWFRSSYASYSRHTSSHYAAPQNRVVFVDREPPLTISNSRCVIDDDIFRYEAFRGSRSSRGGAEGFNTMKRAGSMSPKWSIKGRLRNSCHRLHQLSSTALLL